MSNQSFNQFAGQPAPGPVNPGFAQPGTPQAPAHAWPNQAAPAPQAGPPVAPNYAQPLAATPFVPPVQAAPQGFGTVPQTFAPIPGAFGAGAFGAAKIMGDKLPCAPGLYRFRVVETGQRRDPATGLPYWRLKATVVQVFAGSQPVGSDVTTSQGLTGDQQVQYAGSFFLQLGAACFGVNNEAELKALLNQKYGAFTAQNGLVLDGWAQFADALQNASQQVNNCPANPLENAEFIAEVIPTQAKSGKHAGKTFEKWQALRRVTAT